jgi:hypothetical protein
VLRFGPSHHTLIILHRLGTSPVVAVGDSLVTSKKKVEGLTLKLLLLLPVKLFNLQHVLL